MKKKTQGQNLQDYYEAFCFMREIKAISKGGEINYLCTWKEWEED